MEFKWLNKSEINQTENRIEILAPARTGNGGSRACAAGGSPGNSPVPFPGILITVVFYATGSGLVEVLVSPIVEVCPFADCSGRL